MKGLFLVQHGFSAHSGISKKIFAQCEALCRCGVQTQLCYMQIAEDGSQRRLVGDRVIRDFGTGVGARVLKRTSYRDLTDYIRREKISLLYVRHDLNANPILASWLRRMRREGVRIVLEIPTYPYDAEFAEASRLERCQLALDRLFRRELARQADRIVTFSDDERIFGRPTVRISNGIDFGAVPLKEAVRDIARDVRLLAVANIHPWHGFDRVIEGLKQYRAAAHDRRVLLHIVGDGIPSILEDFRSRIERYGLGETVTLTGPLSGAELDAQFAWCDAGIASLARHRTGITSLKSLKNREYAARGIPFVYSERDSDFDRMPYVMKAPADETPMDIAAFLRFLDAADRTPAHIRASIDPALSWERQMAHVLNEMGILPPTEQTPIS